MVQPVDKRILSLEQEITELGKALSEKIVAHVYAVDKQTAVLEERVNHADRRIDDVVRKISDVRAEIKITNDKLDSVHSMLSAHVVQEGRDRIGLLIGVVAALAGIYLPYIVKLPGITN